ncbi:arginine--tRNA ligase [Paenalkalicoccus suaedae]|uniref:Arginine--tRNA ligase n=1 Tax=Paenalkalicoccus suaedae TaxID=2592382 RepID=A0A859FJX4_9BACI|nr:arginine--tRNA ligase [Paenalkalicoccus suaedae]QKS73086.1 arginine--tRNA ligase [Paenalkalicoccus suaedae]
MIYEQALSILSPHVQEDLQKEEILSLLETPKREFGDVAFPCFRLAKTRRKSKATIAQEIATAIGPEAEAIGGYVNLRLPRGTFAEELLASILSAGKNYGQQPASSKKVAIDFSSPNIAKPFSMGHLRSTVIGHAIARLYEKNGATPIRINHIGDWGTQFGKLIYAYKQWGSEVKIRENPIKELFTLYVRFHEEENQDPTLADKGRYWFKQLEEGDQEATSLWTWFREESLRAFTELYDLLGVTFDTYEGESFYNDKMTQALKRLEDQQLLSESDGATIVSLGKYGYPPLLLKKSDGATLYATRDVAAACYRKEYYKADELVYVVGNEQQLYFNQLQAVLKEANIAPSLSHVRFGMVLQDGKKMSTRKGKVILLEDVLAEAIDLAAHNIEEKNPGLPNKEEVAKQVGVGAILFHDLKNDRLHDLAFSLKDILQFEGETGPYVQYAYARASSLIKKSSSIKPSPTNRPYSDEEWHVITTLSQFPIVLKDACDKHNPSLVARYTLDLARDFSRFYAHEPISQDASKLAIVESVRTVLQEGLWILGIEAPEDM